MAKKPKPRILSKKHIARLERERRQARLVRYTLIGVVLAVLLLIGYGLLDINVLQQQRPVATVNGEPITLHEFQARVRLERLKLINQYTQTLQFAQLLGIDVSSQLQDIQTRLSSSRAMGQQVLDTMINERLIRQEARRRGITVTPQEVEEAIQAFFRFYPNGTPTPTITPSPVVFPTLSPEQLALVSPTPTSSPFPTQTASPTFTPNPAATPTTVPTATVTPFPTPTATPYTLEAYQLLYQDALQGYEKLGISEADFRALFETGLYRDKMYDIITADVAEVQEQVWARHILLPDETTARLVYESLMDGEDWTKLAAELSDDKATAEKGGDLGWHTRDYFVKEFADAAFSLEVGEISQPVQTPYGYHIIQVLGHEMRPLTPTELENARQQAFQQWLLQLREEADIVTYDARWQNNIPVEPTLPAPALAP
ncbi:MAG: hypothetical protein D6770_00970 [Anaerolineae bacterium]|nr:MAG: hypothetical protein D6770_00970 [Anaerolineae bacterium]